MSDARPLSALTIAGSDSGGGAGIQADLKTFAAHGIHGLSAIAALTAQHTRGVTAVHVPPVAFLRAQIDACFGDFRIGAVKLGMLATAEVIHAVADALERYKPPAIVLDPVMVATSGATLLADDALDALRSRLLPLATLLTPNIPEAEWLLERVIVNGDDANAALLQLRGLGSARGAAQGWSSRRRPVRDRPLRRRHHERNIQAPTHRNRCAWHRLHARLCCRRKSLPWTATGRCMQGSERLRIQGTARGLSARTRGCRGARPSRESRRDAFRPSF